MSGGLRLALAVLCGMRILIRLSKWMGGWTRGVPAGWRFRMRGLVMDIYLGRV